MSTNDWEDDPAFPWQDYIHTDPRILSGKPVVRGTRIAVEFILELLANGWTEDQVLEGYPHLRRDALRAVYAYAADRIQLAGA